MTSLTDRTYFFHYKLTHKVPLGGFFSFLLSEDEANGVKISNKDQFGNNCYLLKGGANGTPVSLKCATGLTE